MTITVPTWLLWAFGVIVGAKVLLLAVVGGMFVWCMWANRDWRLWR